MNHPQLHSVAATDAADIYEVVLHSASSEEIVWKATVDAASDGSPGVGLDPGPNGPEPWGGDAELCGPSWRRSSPSTVRVTKVAADRSSES